MAKEGLTEEEAKAKIGIDKLKADTDAPLSE